MRLLVFAIACLVPFAALAAPDEPAEPRVPPEHPCAPYLNRTDISITRALLDCQNNSRSTPPPLTPAEAEKVLQPPPSPPPIPEQ